MQRTCGSCTLCCRLLPGPELAKGRNERCAHQCSKGCRIYARRPKSCAFWNCRWLAGDDTGQRPDRAHYVVDMMPDFVIARPHDGSAPRNIAVAQVWVEPGYDVTNDPGLRAFIERIGRLEGLAALLRDGVRGIFVAPPAINADGTWFVQASEYSLAEHSFEEISNAVAGTAASIKVVVPRDRV
jgi:hypothetical protein